MILVVIGGVSVALLGVAWFVAYAHRCPCKRPGFLDLRGKKL